MTIRAKICGIKDEVNLLAAIRHGAAYIGLNFYPRSPRSLPAEAAGRLARLVPAEVKTVGLIVDAADREIADILAHCPLDILQLHGRETPARCAEIAGAFRLPLMKALPVSAAADIDNAAAYEGIVDLLLFDAKPPANLPNALPGGNAVSFDWSLLAGRRFSIPYMLSGGLHAGNVGAAVGASGARIVDVSSGVESQLGQKDPNKIKEFLEIVRSLA